MRGSQGALTQMTDMLRTVLLFGAPGVGKGTQGKLLGAIPGFVHMASGDIFRTLDRESRLGKKFLQYSSQGLLVPDEVTIEVWRDYVDRQIGMQVYRPTSDLLVLDGIPRNVAQAGVMAGHVQVLRVVHLRPPGIDEMVERLKRRALQEGRHDDADEAVIRRRFEVYEKETSPMLAYYDAGLIWDISALGSPAEVLLKILQAIVPIYSKHFANPLG